MSLFALSRGSFGRSILAATRGERARDWRRGPPGEGGGTRLERLGVEAELGRTLERVLLREGGGEAAPVGVDPRVERRGRADIGWRGVLVFSVDQQQFERERTTIKVMRRRRGKGEGVERLHLTPGTSRAV